jgi:hypothetical protein
MNPNGRSGPVQTIQLDGGCIGFGNSFHGLGGVLSMGPSIVVGSRVLGVGSLVRVVWTS